MKHKELTEMFPIMFHFPSRQPTTLHNGLLSSTKLLSGCAKEGKVKWAWQSEPDFQQEASWEELNSMHRTDAMLVEDPFNKCTHCLRDQRPLGNLAALEKHCLTDMTGPQWIETLNARLYLFPSKPMQKQRCDDADVFWKKYQINPVLLDTAYLPELLLGRVQLSVHNGGTINGVAQRGPNTYVPLQDFPAEEIKEVKEFTVIDGITAEELEVCCISPWARRLLPIPSTMA